MKGRIFDIKRFAVHDGDGVRTTVFFKGCPLRCQWCHNPEGLRAERQIALFDHLCTKCGDCASVCGRGVHRLADGTHSIARENCVFCGACVRKCPADALKIYGKDVTAEELLPLLLEDREFYEASGGGVTLSGGECLLQGDFCAELLGMLKKEGVHTAVDTCGLVDRATLAKVLPATDLFLYDIKAADSEVHRNCTGVGNERILENLRFLDGAGARIEVRIPFVPERNDGEIRGIAELLKPLRHLSGVRVLPYHNYAAGKYASLGMENDLPPRLPTEEEVAAAKEILQNTGLPVI